MRERWGGGKGGGVGKCRPVDTYRDSAYTPVISLMGVAPAAHIITHVVTIQAALIGPILC